jgi:copper resistance protein C
MRRVAAVLAAVVTVLLLTTVPAEAHTTLASSDPAKGATVTSPTRIRLTYTDPVRFTGVVVVDAEGGHHESGKSQAVDDQVTEQVAGVLAPGVYTVGWRVVAPDGHPVTGEYRFTVKGGGGATSPAPTASAASPAARPAERSSGAGWWWIGLVVLVVALAGGGIVLARRRG